MNAGSDVIGTLVELGLNRNEALAYVALLETGGTQGATGYEVGVSSGVPRSAVYKILKRLEELGAAFSVGDDPKKYVATSPERFVETLQRSFLVRAERARERLEGLVHVAQPEPVWTVSRYADVLERADVLIRSARHSVWVSLWEREVQALSGAFAAISARDLHVVLHSPGPIESAPPGAAVWSGHIPTGDRKAGWSHRALVVVDRRHALVGGAEPEADNHAVITTNPSILDVVVNQIVLDITLLARETGRACEEDVAPMLRPHLPSPLGSETPNR